MDQKITHFQFIISIQLLKINEIVLPECSENLYTVQFIIGMVCKLAPCYYSPQKRYLWWLQLIFSL